jgi:CDP-diacylglycerol pyrophosphatase
MIAAAIVAVIVATIAIAALIAAAGVDHRRRSIVTRRCIDHWRRRSSPTKRVEIDIDMDAGVGGSACRQHKRDDSK